MFSYKSVKVFTMISILCILLFLSVELYFRNGFVAFWRRDHDGFTDASFCDTASWLWCVFEAISHVNRSRRVCEHAEKVTAKVCVHSRTSIIGQTSLFVFFTGSDGFVCWPQATSRESYRCVLVFVVVLLFCCFLFFFGLFENHQNCVIGLER